ncbi:MAG: glycosyltransferase [Clostridia bacterium]|nr:glycosyltransferase [Clostridia bacterium]
MKVLLIDVNCKQSSTGKIVYDLYTGINNDGDEAAVCYGRGVKIKEKNIFKFGLNFETLTHAILTRITGYTGYFSFFSTMRLLNYIKKFKPDIVHIHELHAYFVNIRPLINYLKNNNIKTVFSMHCDFMYTGKCGCALNCEKWKNGCGNCSNIKEYPSTLFFDKTAKMYKDKRDLFDGWDNLLIVSASKWLKERAKQSFLHDKMFEVVHNGIDTDIFYPREVKLLRRELGIADDEKVVLSLAPNLMSENKGGRHVLKIAQTLHSEKIKFILIGIEGKLDFSLPNVIALGKIKDKDLLAQYYSLADTFIICSKQETFPTTCLEAQCCGTPILGFDVGGVRETAIENMGNSFVPYGNVEQLEKSLESMLQLKPKISKTLSEKARSKYSKGVMIENYKRLYKREWKK